jgi:cell division protein FtsA
MASGMAIVTKSNGEITTLDVNKALEESESNLTLGNKKIIQVLPISFKLDGKEILGRPEGMRGTKLEVKTLFITCSSQHLDDLLAVVAEAGVEPIDVVAGAVSASYIAMSEKQKIVGGALVNIGSETVSLAIFENGLLISIHTFSIGANDITNDIALGLKITLEDAENLKLGNSSIEHSKKKLDEIISARLSDIFELIENHLKKIKRDGLLPAGIVFVGGGANIPGIENLSKSFLKLPSRVGVSEIFGNTKTKLRDSSWFTVLGLVVSGRDREEYSNGSYQNFMKDLKNAIKSISKQLLP